MLRRISLSLLVLLLLISSVSADEVEKYALLVIGCADTNVKVHPDLDPIDVNASWVNLARLYGTLIECGFKDKDIRILYDTGRIQPDWSEKKHNKELRRIRKYHYSGQYSTVASQANINAIMEFFKKKVDENDIFVFYIMTHGAPSGVVQLAGRSKWTPAQIQAALSGLKSRSNIFCFETCHSGAILNRTNFPNAVCVAAAPATTPGWVDRNFANCVNFVVAKANKKFDKNKDGVVDVNEAFAETKRRAAEYEPEWRKYMKTKYKFPKHSPVPRSMADKTSLTPVMKVGSKYLEKNLFDTKKAKKKTKKKVITKKKTEDRKDVYLKRLSKAEELLKEGKVYEAYKSYERLARVSDKEVAEEAKKRLEELMSDEKTSEEIKKAKEHESVKRKLSMARNYMDNRMFDKAEEICEEVIEKYPSTGYAEEAEKLLKEIEERREE